MLILAQGIKGNEFMYDYTTAHGVAKRSAEKIVTLLNKLEYKLKPGHTWHIYENPDYTSNAYYYAKNQKFTIYRNVVKEKITMYQF